MDRLRCVVERITYQNEQNGYTVLKCRAAGYQDLVTVVGALPEIHVGSVLALTGEWTAHPRFGRQFSVAICEETLPATVYGIRKYLGSGLVRGIGPRFAERIVSTFGERTLEMIEEQPEALFKVPGIGKARVEQIKKSWAEQKEIRNIMLFLQGHNVSTAHATKIWKTYGNDSIRVVTENPYRLADDIWGIGFKTADTIAEKMGFEKEKYARLRSGLLYSLNRLADEGHCYALRPQLTETGAELLGVDASLLEMTLDEMIRNGDVRTEALPYGTENSGTGQETAIYLPPFYFSETGAAKRLHRISEAKRSFRADLPEPEADRQIARATGMEYDPAQTEAIHTAIRSKVMVLTGGPGTGKTTVTLGIITAFRIARARILLAAPTGRAAKRLAEATGMEAKTIHRLLEVKPPEGYQRNEENPLEGDVLIVDECSMIDLLLFYALLRAVPESMTLIFVGDIDQLPSVGAGNVLRDVIDSGAVPVVRLTRIFRQAAASRIITNAHRINRGEMPDLSNGNGTDFFFTAQEDPEKAAQEIIALVKSRLPAYYSVPSGAIQVLTPMQRGAVGAENLNMLIQAAVNPEGEGLRRGGILYRTRDKVMQIRNNYDKEVFNGDIGIITAVDTEERALTVNFDGRPVAYDISELDELVLAYATTIHKSQGSEYPIVVMPIMMTHYVMLQRNLVYTGVTRAKRCLVLIGTRKAVSMAIRNTNVQKRNTLLAERLRDGKERQAQNETTTGE